MEVLNLNVEYSIEDLALFEGFVSKCKILIADSSTISGKRVNDIFVGFGAKSSNIFCTDDFNKAVEYLEKEKPKIIVSEYNFGDDESFSLFSKFNELYDKDRDRQFIVVTGQNDQAKVARACENGVDAYVIKPFSIEDLKKIVLSGAKMLTNPDSIMKLIREGVAHFDETDLSKAKEKFEAALEMDKDFALANFWFGKTLEMDNDQEAAEGYYRHGFASTKVHYQSLFSLYDLNMKNKNMKEAYHIVKILVEFFPENTPRFNNALWLSIILEDYDQIASMNEIYNKLFLKTDEMKKYLSAALVTLGTNQLMQNKISKGGEAFRNAAILSNNKAKVLVKIIEALSNHNIKEEVKFHFGNFIEEEKFGPEYRLCDFYHSNFFEESEMSLEKGNHLINKMDIVNPEVYKFMYEKYKSQADFEGMAKIKELIIEHFPERFKFKLPEAA